MNIISSLWILCIVLWSTPVAGEWYAGIYGGAVFDGNVDTSQRSSLSSAVSTSEVKVEPGFTAGIRGGYWFESLPFGLGVDLFFMRTDTKGQSVPGTVNGTPALVQQPASQTVAAAVALDLLRIRFPLLTTERFPHGRVQPYLSAGPALLFTKYKDTGGTVTPLNQTHSETVLGVKIGAGVNLQISRVVGVFAEYRFTHFKADAAMRNSAPASTEALDRIVDAHHLIGGVSFSF